jgi:hypothetical protein
MLGEYQIKRISKETTRDLVDLYKVVFKKHITEAYLHRKFDTSAFGASYLGYIAYASKEEPVAFYGVLPCHFLINNEIVLAAQSGDTMTHPNHQRRGLFTLLATMTFELSKQNRIKFLFGFPNQNSFMGLKKLNWEFQKEPIRFFKEAVRTLPYAKLTRKSLLFKVLYEHSVGCLFSKGTAITLKNGLPQNENGILRDATFLSYKQYNRSFHLKLQGANLWFEAEGILKVGLLEVPNINPSKFIKALKRIAFALGCSEILFITSTGSTAFQFLNKVIEPQSGFTVGFHNLTDEDWDFEKIKFDYCDIDIF